MEPEQGSRALISRRKLLLGGMAAAAAMGAGLGVALWPGEAAPGRQVLSREEQAVLQRLGEALWPPGNAIGVSWEEAELVAGVDRYLDQECLPGTVLALRELLQLLDLGARLSLGAGFAALPPEQGLQMLQDWARVDKPLRRSHWDGLRTLLAMSYFNHPRVLAALDFGSPCHGGSA